MWGREWGGGGCIVEPRTDRKGISQHNTGTEVYLRMKLEEREEREGEDHGRGKQTHNFLTIREDKGGRESETVGGRGGGGGLWVTSHNNSPPSEREL